MEMSKQLMEQFIFQFPWCVGEFNLSGLVSIQDLAEFQFPWCVGEFNGKHLYYLIYLASRV